MKISVIMFSKELPRKTDDWRQTCLEISRKNILHNALYVLGDYLIIKLNSRGKICENVISTNDGSRDC